MDEFDFMQYRLMGRFDESVQKGGYHWRTKEELADLTGVPETKVACIVMFSGEFVTDSKGRVTTRKLYEKRTPLIKRIQDSWMGTIK
jgi:hypothetical protein